EIIILQVEVAGQLFQPRLENAVHPLFPGQRLELRGRNAKAKERGRLIGKPADESPVEYRSQLGFENRALLVPRLRVQHPPWIDAVQARQQMRRANEPAKQAVLIYAPRKTADPPPPHDVAPLPVTARRFIQMRRNELAVGRDIIPAVGLREEAVEAGMIRQCSRR